MKIFQIPFVLLWLLYAQVSVGQNTIAVSASVDKASIVIGEPAQLKLEAFFPLITSLLFLRLIRLRISKY